jgi:hypothetical protein
MYIVIFPSIDLEKYIVLVFQVDGFGHRILLENTGNHWNMEAVFPPGIFRMISGRILPGSIGSYRNSPEKS